MARKGTYPVYLSLIIPAFNEETRIGRSLDCLLSFFRSQPYSFEVVIVDDGSRDGTESLLRERFASDPEVRIHRQPRNLGKGKAVQQGMLLGSGEYLFFSDADLSVPIEMLPRFLGHLENHCNVAIGTRQKSGAMIEIHQPLYREILGKFYTRLSAWILGLSVSDFTCGFKGFRKEAARDLFSRQRLKNWSFDAEILYLAHLKKYHVAEIPVTWRNDRATKVRLWKDIFPSFLGLLRIRLNHYLGRYK
ncbi:MAG: dolichyl-phosphate beta-glucosyltransferase [Candidatus Binatia bacterium]